MKSFLTCLLAMSLSLAQAAEPAASAEKQTAVFGGGCFWCTEAQYKMLKGVSKVVSGYAGGQVDNPTYKQVCNGDTGHAEVILVEFDPKVISYRDLVDYFWIAHDPTTLNRQGADEGTQYRSTIMFSNEAQRLAAEASRAEAAKEFSSPIVTEIVPLKKFYPAEDYHQDYFANNPQAGYCRVVVGPKVAKFREKLAKKDRLKPEAK